MSWPVTTISCSLNMWTSTPPTKTRWPRSTATPMVRWWWRWRSIHHRRRTFAARSIRMTRGRFVCICVVAVTGWWCEAQAGASRSGLSGVVAPTSSWIRHRARRISTTPETTPSSCGGGGRDPRRPRRFRGAALARFRSRAAAGLGILAQAGAGSQLRAGLRTLSGRWLHPLSIRVPEVSL